MIVVMTPDATQDDLAGVQARLAEAGYGAHLSQGEKRTIIGVIGAGDDEKQTFADQVESLPGVERVIFVLKPYKLVSQESRSDRSVVEVGEARFGGPNLVVCAGPCSVESHEQILECARAVKAAGAQVLRGGAFKPRTSPYDFQGLGETGLDMLAAARDETGLPIVTEARAVKDVELVAEKADVIQIGARNMQNYDLLQAAGESGAPVLLKRGLSATIDEWLKAAEYIAATGNLKIILCERGIRTFETTTRNTLDIAAVPVAQKLTHLPIVVDPSHAGGRRDLVLPLSMAGIAAGADGLIIEVHPQPDRALSDGAQSLTPDAFSELMIQVRTVSEVVGKPLPVMAGKGVEGASWEP
ncbi:MAG: 3-deoxy-7-phosphoheptulonate synthase [Armatimonadia bacterium]|nr:3-deoxy-7-phosphoheptulonate synthase [Armatimonadia bacterium]